MKRGALAALAACLTALLVMTAPAAAASNVVVSINTTESELTSGTVSGMVGYGGSTAGSLTAGASGTTTTRPADNNVFNGVTSDSGVTIQPNTNLTAVSGKVSANTAGATTAYLVDGSSNVLETAPIVNGQFMLVHPMVSGTQYAVTVDAEGSAWDQGTNNSASFPYTSTDLDIVGNSCGYDCADPTSTSGSHVRAVNDLQAITPTSNPSYQATHGATNATEGFANVSLSDASATITWEGTDDGGSTWTQVASTTVSTSQNVSQTLGDGYSKYRVTVSYSNNDDTYTAELHDEGVIAPVVAPQADNSSASPSGGEKLDTSDVTFSINISDGDFSDGEGDSVTATFYLDGSKIGTDTLSSNGTASLTHTVSEGGSHNWHADLEDSYSQTGTSDTFSFKTPSKLYIRNESNASELVTNAQVTVRFFTSDTVVERTTSDGTVDLSGLPTDETMVVTAEASGWHDRRVIIKSLYEQQSVYLLNQSVSTVTTDFFLDDKTGDYPSDSRLYIKKPINQSGSTTYKTIVADEFGAAGVSATLEKDQRYRLVVENPQGDTRVVGPYTASSSQSVTLTIGKLTYILGDSETYSWSASYSNSSGSPEINFNFTDPAQNTTDLNVRIYEHGNESNEIYNNTFAGPLGEVSVTKLLTKNQSEKTWVVEFEGSRNGGTIRGSRVVGETGGPGIPMDQFWKEVISVAVLMVIGAGLGAGMQSPEAAGIVIALFAAIFWYMAWLPPAIGGGAIVVGIVFPGLMMWSKSRGAAA